jgi:hypothetical protein
MVKDELLARIQARQVTLAVVGQGYVVLKMVV